MTFQINGTDMAIAPYNQEWQDIVQGTDQNGRPVFSAVKNVKLDFPPTTIVNYRNFSMLNGTSLTSITLLNIDGSSYTTYNNGNIYVSISQRPKFDAGNVTGYTVLVSGITPS